MHGTVLALAVREVVDETLLASDSHISFQSFVVAPPEYQVEAAAALDSAGCVNGERSSVGWT